jgi:hypothetical protein
VFHTYIQSSAGVRSVDFDRASFLMDRTLLGEAIEAMKAEMAMKADTASKAQWVWDYYCRRHIEKYGTPFRPDVDPNWDG